GSPRLLDQVVEACLPTHATCVAISGAAAVASAVAAACVEGAGLADLLAAARLGAVAGRARGEWAWGTPLEGRIDLALALVARGKGVQATLADLGSYVGADMLVAESVAAAFGVVALAGGDPMKAVVYAANLGGDTDTMAAIAGAVCGALGGIEAIDPDLLSQVEAANRLDLAGEARAVEAIQTQSR
ncbi:MAG: ADP-ribosylglycohydrolase family protein, partial [Chloroflexi bacterium]|nr:ADP-ribosylglycohydrolase family protein [Chloroflexota bacterium]